jgi:tripartite-type tricarboxylate transporter receptor subunit TctC
MMMLGFRALFLSLIMAIAVLGTVPPSQADEADFFKGRNMTWIVSTGPGGGHDFYARLISRHMEANLPGATIVVKNVPGAGHIIGANMVYAAKPDGLTIGSFSTGLVYGQLVSMKGIQFDLGKMSWVGKASSDPRVMVVSKKSPFKTLADMQKSDRPVVFVASGVGGGSYNEAHMVGRAFDFPYKVLTGYAGNEGHMSMMRGESDAAMDGAETSMVLVDRGEGFLMLQFGKEIPNVPDGADFAKTEQAKTISALLEAQSVLARITAGPPQIPAARLEVLRSAYRKTLESPALLADAKKAKRSVHPAYGEDVAKAIRAALAQPPEVVELLKTLVTKLD